MFLFDLPPASPATAETIVVTASRSGERQSDTPSSSTVLAPERVERLGEPLLAGLLRLTPSAALAEAGPAGSQAQLRLRGAEANHTLLFIDGIRANDPAAGNEPRFELLNAALGDRVEIVRGPQSALWGSEAIGGVVAITAQPRTGASALAEGGSHDFGRLSAQAGLTEGSLALGISADLQGAAGINALDTSAGDKDGYRNAAVRARADWRQGPFAFSAGAFAIRAISEFDGFDPLTFLRADTEDESRNRLWAARLGGSFEQEGWTARVGVSRLQSRNRNYLADAEQNRTSGQRSTVTGEVGRTLFAGAFGHRLTAAAEWSEEKFEAEDDAFGGFTDQDRRRDQSSLTGEWRTDVGPVTATLAVRHDRFSDFADATTARLGAILRLKGGWQIAGSYGSGIAQPTFFDLYGFFPGSFRGNPDLRPERSRGGEISLRKMQGVLQGSVTLFRQRLTDEIVDRFDPATFLSTAENAPTASRRSGAEFEASFVPSPLLGLRFAYAFLDAEEPAGRELRRPRHSGSIVADGTTGALTYAAAVSYTGRRFDRDFDVFPSRLVRLGAYWLASARLAYRLNSSLEVFGRLANAFNSDASDVFGYRREGRSAYAGIRVGFGR